MPGILRTIAGRAVPAIRGHIVIQRANLQSRPPKEVVGPVENVIGMGVITLSILAPSGWILAHLEDYKKKV